MGFGYSELKSFVWLYSEPQKDNERVKDINESVILQPQHI